MGLAIYVFSLFAISVIGLPSEAKEVQRIKECRHDEVIENDCIKCICSKRKVFECIPKKCNSLEIETSCRPDTIYVTDTETCICNRFGKWPNQDCSNIFQNLPDRDHCEPDTYVNVDCNVCRCGSDGKIDKDRCTKNPCEELKKEARRQLDQVNGACTKKSWYSLAPCQFCYCVNENKLVCNTGNNKLQRLELGSYKLNVCGQDLLKDAYDLVPLDYREVLRGGNNKVPANLQTINPEIKKIIFENDTNVNQAAVVSPPNDANYDLSDSESKSSESEENLGPQIRLQEYTAKPSTQLVESAESTENKIKDKHTEGKNAEYSNEIPVETVEMESEKPKVMAVNTVMKSEMDTIQSFRAPANIKVHENFSPATQPRVSIQAEPAAEPEVNFLLPKNLNIPGVLREVFQIALKKSMVSIVEDTKCKPGTTTAVKCNVCFCTTDSKMICTNTKC